MNTPLRALQIIHLGLASGVLLFTALVVILTMQQPANPAADPTLARMLTLVHGVLFLTALLLSRILYHRLLPTPDLDEAAQVARFRTARIVRLAVLEGAALFGLVTCLLLGQSGLIQAQPVYWLNLLSTGFFLAFIALTFPRQDPLG
jgi:hypothetical protein